MIVGIVVIRLVFWAVEQSRIEGRDNYSYHHPLRTHHPLPFCSRVKVAGANVEGVTGRVCEIAEDPVCFKSDIWKHF